ncbi:DUF1772 domain-containing protein [Pseudonocardia ailaonensis]|uniref:DUF1772 domain-containing protein n=1 Tax=Pseudonocardia ailaonensis TaxID=367279 RepID=A0ABN2NES5_9PSEU
MSTTTVVAAVTALGAGSLGGLFLAFSTAVLPGLVRRPAEQAAAAMREINRAIVNPVFLLVFAGTALTSAATVVLGLLDGRPLLAIGAGLTLLGAHVITAARNIPLNDALDRAQGAAAWEAFAGPWNRAHRVRTLLTIAGAAVLTAGLVS